MSDSPPVLEFSYSNMCAHKALKVLHEKVDLEHQCGYVTMLNCNNRNRRRPSDADAAGERASADDETVRVVHI